METVRKRIPDPVRILAVVAAVYLLLKFGINPPLPSSLIMMYMALLTVGAIIYSILFYDVYKTFLVPLLHFFAGDAKSGMAKQVRLALLIVFPFLIWGWTYRDCIRK